MTGLTVNGRRRTWQKLPPPSAPRPGGSGAADGERDGDRMKTIELQWNARTNLGTMWWGKKLLDEHKGNLIACSNYFQVAQKDWQESKWGFYIVYDLTINRNYAA
jgi:hypothetical protein